DEVPPSAGPEVLGRQGQVGQGIVGSVGLQQFLQDEACQELPVTPCRVLPLGLGWDLRSEDAAPYEDWHIEIQGEVLSRGIQDALVPGFLGRLTKDWFLPPLISTIIIIDFPNQEANRGQGNLYARIHPQPPGV